MRKILTTEQNILLEIAESREINRNNATMISRKLNIPLSTTTYILNKLRDVDILKWRICGKTILYTYISDKLEIKFKYALIRLKEAYQNNTDY